MIKKNDVVKLFNALHEKLDAIAKMLISLKSKPVSNRKSKFRPYHDKIQELYELEVPISKIAKNLNIEGSYAALVSYIRKYCTRTKE